MLTRLELDKISEEIKELSLKRDSLKAQLKIAEQHANQYLVNATNIDLAKLVANQNAIDTIIQETIKVNERLTEIQVIIDDALIEAVG